jgi:hypothetical protein
MRSQLSRNAARPCGGSGPLICRPTTAQHCQPLPQRRRILRNRPTADHCPCRKPALRAGPRSRLQVASEQPGSREMQPRGSRVASAAPSHLPRPPKVSSPASPWPMPGSRPKSPRGTGGSGGRCRGPCLPRRLEPALFAPCLRQRRQRHSGRSDRRRPSARRGKAVVADVIERLHRARLEARVMIRSARPVISSAARREKISSRIRNGSAPASISCTTRCANALALPVPSAAARRSTSEGIEIPSLTSWSRRHCI